MTDEKITNNMDNRFYKLISQFDESAIKEVTPKWVVDDMLDLLPDEVWCRNTRFLDIYSKSGVFLYCIMEHLMTKAYDLIEEFPDEDDRKAYIVENQLFGLSWTNIKFADTTRAIVNRKASRTHHMAFIEGDYKVYLKGNGKLLNDELQRIKTEEFDNNMKFDVVVGNPPYNNDIYLEFVQKGYEWSSKYTLMITPAKWQAKGGEKNEQFRKDIVPHMSKIVYYPDAGDIFNIAEHSGITYYLIDNNIHNSKEIKNVCVFQSLYNDCEQRNIFNATLCNKGAHLVDKILKKELNIERLDKSRRYKVWCANKLSLGRALNGIPHPFSKDGDLLCSGIQQVEDSKTNKVVYEPIPSRRGGIADDSKVIFSSESLDECKYFISFCYTRIVRYLLSLSLCGVTGIATGNEWWRFVPDPGAFDHIFDDWELFKKYNLSADEIDIIMQVIKERHISKYNSASMEYDDFNELMKNTESDVYKAVQTLLITDVSRLNVDTNVTNTILNVQNKCEQYMNNKEYKILGFFLIEIDDILNDLILLRNNEEATNLRKAIYVLKRDCSLHNARANITE